MATSVAVRSARRSNLVFRRRLAGVLAGLVAALALAAAWLYWPGLAVFVVVALVLAGLTLHAVQTGAWTAAAFVGGFCALFLWQSGGYFRRNRPGRYRPDDPPRHLVPGG